VGMGEGWGGHVDRASRTVVIFTRGMMSDRRLVALILRFPMVVESRRMKRERRIKRIVFSV
jgi:hypothetical protein